MPDFSSEPREKYDPSLIEPKWQRFWDEHKTFATKRHPGKPKMYILDMFPYPSGAGLHVGHPEGYTATDIVARYKRARGFDVLHPMGWDAFGLPAEQHAIKTGTHPRATTLKNIDTFRRQLKMLGFSYDWDREIDTTDSRYVRWTQWIFLQMFKRGLAFQQSDMPVNWCPALGTVLANDEVIDGKSEVGGHPVEKLKIRQWSLRITEYADRLDEDLTLLDWPDTKAKQHNWIGRSEGALVDFEIEGRAEKITVFTTRVDTLAGATYVVLAPEHALVDKIAGSAQKQAISEYVEATRKKSDIDRSDATREKSGVAIGALAVNPINGEKLPIWIADYVIATYGTGAVMAVPAHDERDHAFAKKYDLPIIEVISGVDGASHDVQKESFNDDGLVNAACVARSKCALTVGTSSEHARKKITEWLTTEKKGSTKVTYKLRDWVFSRQRYWGEPIPIYFPITTDGDPRKGAKYTIHYERPIAVDEADLPLNLPDLEDFKPTGDPEGPLARVPEWRFFQKDGAWFARETNTMPQWAGSCWYYLRFLDPKNDDAPFSKAAYDAWMPVDLYVGGSEHAVLHLMYARFWHKVLFDMGIVSHPEPFKKLVHQGMILGENNQKMSKSLGNVINPDDVVNARGADALRLYEMFMGPLEQVKPWQSSGIEGVRRFLDRAFAVCLTLTDEPSDPETKKVVHKAIKKVSEDIDNMRFNTAVAAMMILVKHLGQLKATPRDAAKVLALLLSPFAPHLAEELWQRILGDSWKTSLALEKWPDFDPELVREALAEIGVQVNGKLRGVIRLAVDASNEDAEATAVADEKVRPFVEGKTIKKIIYVPGKILNFIVA